VTGRRRCLVRWGLYRLLALEKLLLPPFLSLVWNSSIFLRFILPAAPLSDERIPFSIPILYYNPMRH